MGGKKRARESKDQPDDGPAPDYGSLEYWDQRYQDKVPLEWYYTYEHLQPFFERHAPKDAQILDVGCGNVPFVWDLRKAGYTGRIHSFDFAPTAVDQLQIEKKASQLHAEDDGIEFSVMDARHIKFPDASFDMVVDKGTIDAVMCDNKSGVESARAICEEVARVLRPGGWYMVTSHVPPESDMGDILLQEVLVPGLQLLPQGDQPCTWSIDAHCSETEGACPTVYMIHKRPRKLTRSTARGEDVGISLKIHEY